MNIYHAIMKFAMYNKIKVISTYYYEINTKINWTLYRVKFKHKHCYVKGYYLYDYCIYNALILQILLLLYEPITIQNPLKW
jgi:hypothetical protein